MSGHVMTADPASLRIVIYPDPVLRERAQPVQAIDEEVRRIAARMIDLMHEAEGVGLAAPQVGLSWRLFVSRGAEEGDPDDVFVNPEIEIHRGEPVVHEEGCLSLPNVTGEIRRTEAVTLTALDLQGRPVQREQSGFVARVWQHEIDHLNGVLIIDRMSPMDRIANRKTIKGLERSATTVPR